MYKKVINYYAVIILMLFIIYNIILENLKIGGLLYQIIMIVLIVSNAVILIIFKKDIKYKNVVCVLYFFIWLFSKNALQCYFDFSNIIILCITGFTESKFTKIFSIIVSIFIVIFFLPLYFVFLLRFGTSLSEASERNNIYDDMHYYCDNNYEVYSYSSGAMDRFHYSIGKHYDILDVDGIIYISYNELNEVTQENYENYLKNNNCSLMEDINGSK